LKAHGINWCRTGLEDTSRVGIEVTKGSDCNLLISLLADGFIGFAFATLEFTFLAIFIGIVYFLFRAFDSF